MIMPCLYIKRTENKGRAVFTSAEIGAGTIVEESPVIIMSKNERILLDKTLLHDYIFEWGLLKDKCCMALGYIPMYNHNYKSNCEYFMDFDLETIQVKAIKNIDKEEELTINYNGDHDNGKKVWFDVKL
jgi:SET domain-containing protein